MSDKSAKPLHTMADVRAAIDDVDRRIVPLLLERLSYIKAAGFIKSDREAVRDDDRVEDVVAKVMSTAHILNGKSDYIEDVYRYIIEYSINYEFDIFDAANSD